VTGQAAQAEYAVGPAELQVRVGPLEFQAPGGLVGFEAEAQVVVRPRVLARRQA
jgi:hypothetical protein